jgi:hypothetical protein
MLTEVEIEFQAGTGPFVVANDAIKWRGTKMACLTLRCGAAAVVLLLSQAVRAGENAHDKLVYSRYSKKFQPTAYKVDHNGNQAQLLVPGPKPGFWKREADETPKVGDPLLVGLHVRTPFRPQEFPSTWYKDARHGGPAILSVVSLSLRWAPFDPSYPVLRKFIGLEPIRTTHFAPDATKRTVKPPESCELLAFDLRDWFKVDKEGYYEVSVRIDWKSLGLHDKVYGNLECSRDLTVGKRPRLPGIEAFNKTLLVLGGPANEERLKRVIRESIKAKTHRAQAVLCRR